MRTLTVPLMIVALFLILSACGGGGGGVDAPAESTLTTSVASISVEFAETDPYSCSIVDSFVISAKTASGIPLNNVTLTIFFPYAQPYGSIQLYDGNPASGAPAKDAPMTVTTDENGIYILYFTYCGGGGVEYKSDFTVTSGALFEAVTFEVKKVSDA
ncbi:MAG: hypothetical protein HZA16_04540 [Nitrospirae bacterium]|nr:hypothetical protein [Nitrospirota bacterium]